MCPFKIYRVDGERVVIRFLNQTNTLINVVIGGPNFVSDVTIEEEILRTGSIKYELA